MRALALCLTLAAALVATAADAQPRGRTAATVTNLCPQIKRTPVTRLAQYPAPVRKALGHMANPGGRWNAGDAIGPGEERFPFRRLIAGGDIGGGRWLVIWEQGGFAHFENVEVYEVVRGRGPPRAHKLISETGGQAYELCRRVAAKLRSR